MKCVVEKTFGSRYNPHFKFLAGIGSAGFFCMLRGMELPATKAVFVFKARLER